MSNLVIQTKPGRPLPGALVAVRPWPEILGTLDRNGCLEALPFMPEMVKFCGQRFRVSKRLERTCEETEGGMRRIRNVVFLEGLRCDGTAHGGCQKGCYFFWKDSWLQKVDEKFSAAALPAPMEAASFPFACQLPDGQFVCQSAELIRATAPLAAWDVGMFVRDVQARTYSPGALARNLAFAAALRLRKLATGKSYRFLEGQQTKTPAESLNLQPGEWVEVKSREEIAATLDSRGQNRGLAFTVEMLPFCGGRYRVLRRLEQMIDEPSRKLIPLHNTVLLENVICDGCHILRGGCPRENYHFWREIWLRRVPPNATPGPVNAPKPAAQTLPAGPGSITPANPQSAGVGAAELKAGWVTPAQSGEWDALVTRHPLGTIYHLWAWKAAMESAFPHIRGRFLGLWDPASGQLTGGVALYTVRSWLLGNRLLAAPFATLCDPLLQSPEDLRRLQAPLEQLHRELSARSICIKARAPVPGMEACGFRPVQDHWHHFLPLTGEPDTLLKGFSRTNVRQWIQRAERAGLTVERYVDEPGMTTFYPMFVNTRRRLGLPWLPYAFFAALQQHLGPRKISVFLAKKDQTPIAGVLTLHFKDTLTLELLGEAPAAAKSGAVQLSYWTAIQWACQEGYRFVSFGRTHKNNEGLASHKRCWSCVEEPLTELVYSPGPLKLSQTHSGPHSSLPKRWLGVLLQRAPLPLGSALGRYFYRHWA